MARNVRVAFVNKLADLGILQFLAVIKTEFLKAMVISSSHEVNVLSPDLPQTIAPYVHIHLQRMPR